MPILDPNEPLAHLTGDQIRELFDRAIQDEATNNARKAEEEAALDFVTAHPEYKRTPRNGALLQTALEYSGTQVRTFEDIEEVYNDMRQRGLLELDNEVLQQQELEARRARIARARGIRTVQRAEETAQDMENQAWSMPFDQLVELANEEMRGQDQSGGIAGIDYEPSQPLSPSNFRSRRRSGI